MIKALVVLLALSSSVAFAEFNMNQVSAKYSRVKPPEAGKDPCVIKTMPKTKSQDGLAICYSSAASTLLDEFKCHTKNNEKCTEVSDAEKISQLDLARYSRNITDEDMRRDREEYQGLVIGGSLYLTLLQTWYADSLVSEECAPLDQVIIGISDVAGVQAQLWQKLENFFINFRKGCATCDVTSTGKSIADIKKEFQLKQDTAVITKAMAQDTWEKALDQLLIPEKCRDWRTQLSMGSKYDRPQFFPPNDVKPEYQKILDKIKEVTCEKKRPVGISFCAADLKKYKTTAACAKAGFGHAVVIEGYREMCDKKMRKCVPSFKIRNSWGEGWQKSNNDGWIDAKLLIDATNYDQQPLTWLEVKPPTVY